MKRIIQSTIRFTALLVSLFCCIVTASAESDSTPMPYLYQDIPYGIGIEETKQRLQAVGIDTEQIVSFMLTSLENIQFAEWPVEMNVGFDGRDMELSYFYFMFQDTDMNPLDPNQPENFEDMIQLFHHVQQEITQTYGPPDAGVLRTPNDSGLTAWDYPQLAGTDSPTLDTALLRAAASENNSLHVSLFFRNIILRMTIVPKYMQPDILRVTEMNIVFHSPADMERIKASEGWNGRFVTENGPYVAR